MKRETHISLALCVASFCSIWTFAQQTNLWQQVGDFNPVHLKTFTPIQAQLVKVKKALVARVRRDGWPCAYETDLDWTENLQFEELPVSDTDRIVLVEAGAGCARGGQGANGAMWVLNFHGDEFTFIATPRSKFNGWLYSIQQTSSHGFRDLVLGWHMSARETELTYFRFTGKSYQAIGQANYFTDGNGSGKIIPKAATSIH